MRAGGNRSRLVEVVDVLRVVLVEVVPGRGARPANTGGWVETAGRTVAARPRQFLAHRWYFWVFRVEGLTCHVRA